MKLIVNADDFGKTAEVNAAIEEAFRRNYITQTTLMVNMPFADEAVVWAKKNGFQDKIGLHLNLDIGLPLSKEMRACRFFCNENGEFDNRVCRQGLFWHHLGEEETHALSIELGAQVNKYLSYGLKLLHCDSHHSVHLRLPVINALLPILQDSNFKTIRPHTSVGLKEFHWRHPAIRMRIYNAYLNLIFNQYRLKRPTEFDFFRVVERCYQYLPSTAIIEVMVHPDHFLDGILFDDEDFPMDVVGEFINKYRIETTTYRVLHD